MSSRVRELEVNNHALTARLKELQEQLDAQALQNRCCYPAEVMCVIFVLLQGGHGKEGPRDRLPERATHRLDSGVPGVARDQDRPGHGDRCLQVPWVHMVNLLMSIISGRFLREKRTGLASLRLRSPPTAGRICIYRRVISISKLWVGPRCGAGREGGFKRRKSLLPAQLSRWLL